MRVISLSLSSDKLVLQQSVCRLCTEVYTFVLVAWLTRIFFNYFAKVFNHVNKKLLPSTSLAKDAISHCGDSIEGKVVIAVDELKESDCGKATEETEKDAEVEKSDYIDEDTNDMDKLRLSKNRPRSCLNMMKAEKQLTVETPLRVKL
jgi:hypothetical protein